MLSFLFGKKKSLSPVTQLPIKVDVHSHILPGIDDGSPNIETSLELIKGLMKLGIERSIATPHVIGDLYRNTPETIGAALQLLQDALAKEQIQFPVSAAAEYMLDDFFLQLLHQKKPLLTLHNKIILTEQSYAAPTGNLHEIAYEIMKAGYKPIMAHPERYAFYHNNFDAYTDLKDMGFILQVNLLSLTGYYGKPVAKAAKHILKQGLADLIATDLHHHRHLAALSSSDHLEAIHLYTQDRYFNELDRI